MTPASSAPGLARTYRVFLERLIARKFDEIHGLTGVFVASLDGHGVVHRTDLVVDAEPVSSASSAVFAAADVLVDALRFASCEHITMQTPDGPVVMLDIPGTSQPFVLTLMAHQYTSMGSLLLWGKGLASEVADVISGKLTPG